MWPNRKSVTIKTKNDNEHQEYQEPESETYEYGNRPVRGADGVFPRLLRRQSGHPAVLSVHGGDDARAQQGDEGADSRNPLRDEEGGQL